MLLIDWVSVIVCMMAISTNTTTDKNVSSSSLSSSLFLLPLGLVVFTIFFTIILQLLWIIWTYKTVKTMKSYRLTNTSSSSTSNNSVGRLSTSIKVEHHHDQIRFVNARTDHIQYTIRLYCSEEEEEEQQQQSLQQHQQQQSSAYRKEEQHDQERELQLPLQNNNCVSNSCGESGVVNARVLVESKMKNLEIT
mmetsp:Transcript_13108/g.18846  ORF Transcript_13108/g.18846 Transcript_13108/m.18846 type:complete len:193 (+) Transcript_13108:3-581(+)